MHKFTVGVEPRNRAFVYLDPTVRHVTFVCPIVHDPYLEAYELEVESITDETLFLLRTGFQKF